MNGKEKLRDQIIKATKEGKIAFATFEGVMSMPLHDFLQQPVDGILYDLNRLPEFGLANIDDPKWINDFAVAAVIRELYSRAESAEAALATEREKHRWIPVSERLPKEDRSKRIEATDGKWVNGDMTYFDSQFWVWDYDMEEWGECYCVTHWKPLSEPPDATLEEWE